MAITIQQIAERAGVSRGTVDRALNKRGRINPEVAQEIERVAKELGYVHKPRKRQKGTISKMKIGVVTQLSGAPFMLEVDRGIWTVKRELEQQGVEVLIKARESVKEEEQILAIEELIEEGIHGLAIMPVDSDNVRTYLNWVINEKEIPVVTFNSDIVGTNRSCFVGMDNKRSGRTAAGLMGMLMQGVGKVLVITGHFSSLVNNLRVDGFVEEAKKVFPKLEIAGVQGSFNDAKEVERIVESSMNNMSGINAIFIVSSGQEGIEKAFDKLGLDQRPYVIVYDQTPQNEMLLKKGIADFLIDQNGFEQGYRPPRVLVDMLLQNDFQCRENLFTGIDIKTKHNL